MDNLEANSKSTQPETQNTGGNNTDSKQSTGHSETHNSGGTNLPRPADLTEIGEHKPSNSASVSNTRPEDPETNHSGHSGPVGDSGINHSGPAR